MDRAGADGESRVWYDEETRTCFLLSHTRQSWPASVERCLRGLHGDGGGRLVEIETAEQLAAVGRMTTAADQPAAWVGARRRQTDWTWSDGTLLGNEWHFLSCYAPPRVNNGYTSISSVYFIHSVTEIEQCCFFIRVFFCLLCIKHFLLFL